MKPRHDWKARVLDHAKKTGAANLAPHTVDELAAHLEDIYLEAIRAGRGEGAALRAADGALAESPLATVPVSRTRVPETRPHLSPPGSGWIGIGGDLRFAWRQLRRAPSFAAIASQLDAPISGHTQTMIDHAHDMERLRLPPEARSGIDTHSIETERQASAYLTDVMARLRATRKRVRKAGGGR